MTMEREKRAAYLREWRAKNKEKNKEYDQKQRQRNADKIKERSRLAYFKAKESETEHKSYRVSVVAYEIMTNTKLPKGKVIDHVNGLKTDNAWYNLRLTTPRGNNQNKKIHRQGRLVGYTFDKKRQLYVAQISINQRAKRLGCFISELEAHQVYIKACEEIGE